MDFSASSLLALLDGSLPLIQIIICLLKLEKKQYVILKKKRENLREKLVKSLSYIEAKIDFAEDDLPGSVLKEVQKSIKQVHTGIKRILEDQKVGEKIRDGFRISIIGDVNAGKSSLLNLLAKRDAAIVSEEEGTTRDVVETYLNIDGYPVILSDTAGIRKAKNKVEKEGIKREMHHWVQSSLLICPHSGREGQGPAPIHHESAAPSRLLPLR